MRLEQLRTALNGISGILVTPFDDDDQINITRLNPIVDRAINAGVHILVSNGNTGEFYSLTLEEAEIAVRETCAIVDGRAPVIGGVGRSVQDACRLARTSVAAGVDALMVHHVPDPFVAPRGVVDYVQAIADSVPDTPLILYIRSDILGVDAIASMCDIEQVIGVKWATPSPLNLAAAMAASDPSIAWVGGLAEVWAPPLYSVGARGFTSGLINVWPERSVAIHSALETGDWAMARTLIKGMRPFEDVRAQENGGANVSGVKAALQMIGNDCGSARAPAAWPLASQQMSDIQNVVDVMQRDMA